MQLLASIRIIIRRFFNFIIFVAQILGKMVYLYPIEKQEQRVLSWNDSNGDQTLRLNYNLNEKSVVVDVGGYEGQWASDIFGMYCCVVHIFEPVSKYAENIAKRFEKNKNIRVYPFGLSGKNERVYISCIGDQSSTIKKNDHLEQIKLIDAAIFFKENNLKSIDLMKINIEGGEYELLERLIESGFINNIRNIQVQFHDFVENAEQRMKDIQQNLSKTHKLTYQFPFVWENWEIK